MAITSTEEVTEKLREHIMSGQIPPGQKLQQIQLSEALGVSRTPLRTALTQLANEGLLEYTSNRGYTVRDFSIDEVVAAYEARAALEGYAAATAARKGITDGQSEVLKECLKIGDYLLQNSRLNPEDINSYREMNVKFHQTILAGANNRWLSDLVTQTHNIPFTSTYLIIWQDHQIMARAHDDHHRVYHAIKTRDATRAEATMREHVLFAGEYLKRCVDQGRLSLDDTNVNQ